MKAEIKIPLSPTYALEVPKGSKITGLRMENDIPRVMVEAPFELTTAEEIANPGPVEFEVINLRVYMEGETEKIEDDGNHEGGKPYIPQPIPIPEPSDKLRKLAVFETVECVATWHVFQSIE